MNDDAPRAPARQKAKLRIESLPFREIPHQSRLFLDYLNDPVSLRKYYPNAVASVRDLNEFAPKVLAEYHVDRDSLCDALVEINAGDATFANIECLRKPDTVAVVTGQQAGLFTGPLFTVYKALSAIKTAEQLTAAGTPAVPVFWVASEDHDVDEVSEAFFIGGSGELVRTEYRPSEFVEGVPVGEIEIDGAIPAVINELMSQLAPGASFSEVRAMLEDSWSAGSSFAVAFAKNLAAILKNFGVIFIDPLHNGLKDLSSPIYADAIEKADEIVSSVRRRSTELEDAGYHAQVLVDESYFPLFWHADDGRRIALRKVRDGLYRRKDEGREFTLGELAEIAKNEPKRLSPGVMLRPVVQDYLLPTLCYFGGSAEIAYFAQNSETYRVLGRPVTPIFHRQSFTIIEPKQARAFEKLEIDFSDMFDGVESTMKEVVERSMSPATARLFAEVEHNINIELNRLDQALSDFDPTLANNLATRRRKIIYHIAALRKKAYRAQIRKAETVDRQIKAAFNALLPKGQLQERVINIHSFLNKYGPSFIDWLYDAVDLDDRRHRVIYI